MKKVSIVLISLCLLTLFSACGKKIRSGPETSELAHNDFDFFYVSDGGIKEKSGNVYEALEFVFEEWLKINSLDVKYPYVRAVVRLEQVDPDPPAREGEYVFDYKSYRFFLGADFDEFINAPENGLYKEAMERTLEGAHEKTEKLFEDFISKRP